jgi:hypothetical protein
VRRSIERTFKIISNEGSDMNQSRNEDSEDKSEVPPKVHILRILLQNLPDIN